MRGGEKDESEVIDQVREHRLGQLASPTSGRIDQRRAAIEVAQARLLRIGAIATLALACDRAPRASVAGDSSVARQIPVDSTVPRPIPDSSTDDEDPEGSFAYVDSTGTLLLSLASVRDSSTIRGAICGQGVALSVRYDRTQNRRPTDSGRQLASNFANEKGDVYRVARERAPPNKSCYLSSDTALLANARAATMSDPSECLPKAVARLTAAKQRRVVHCWHIASAPAHREVLAVQFVSIDSNALASLAVVGDSSLWFNDFPAVYDKLEGSTWRVDDGGVFSPADFDILFVAAMPDGYVMAIAWAGSEGESCTLLRVDSTGAFRTRVKGYRYWVPT